jgi:hypothetical protein
LENTRDACIFSLPSMVRFLLVLAWVVIQGEIKTGSVLFALFKFSIAVEIILLFPL